MTGDELPYEFPLQLTEEQLQALRMIGSGDVAVGIRRSILMVRARYECDEAAQRYAELLEEDEGIEPDVADILAMQAFGHLSFTERAWMGVPATQIATLVEPAWRRAKARSLAWIQEYLRCALGMNRIEVSTIANEVWELLRERDILRGGQRTRQRSMAKSSTTRKRSS